MMNNAVPFDQLIQHYQARIQQQLTHWLSQKNIDDDALNDAVTYALLQGGKRLRPALVYAVTEMLHTEIEVTDAAAMAIECIHAYSLVHDDLPAMDNDELRRGQPTCHIAFGEATAILTGDILQSLAFEILTQANKIKDNIRLEMINTLAVAANKMVIGQALDMQASKKNSTSWELMDLEKIHHHKTGALISASVHLAALACQATKDQHQALQQYAEHLGLAFQIQDDILDITGETQLLGKNIGMDAQQQKLTYPALLGLQAAKEKAQAHYQKAVDVLSMFGESAIVLRELANHIVHRKN